MTSQHYKEDKYTAAHNHDFTPTSNRRYPLDRQQRARELRAAMRRRLDTEQDDVYRERKRYSDLKQKAVKWRNKCLQLERQSTQSNIDEDSNRVATLLKENKQLEQDLLDLTKKLNTLEADSERQSLRKDGEIDRLKYSLDDLKERYRDIKEDNKELRHAHASRN